MLYSTSFNVTKLGSRTQNENFASILSKSLVQDNIYKDGLWMSKEHYFNITHLSLRASYIDGRLYSRIYLLNLECLTTVKAKHKA